MCNLIRHGYPYQPAAHEAPIYHLHSRNARPSQTPLSTEASPPFLTGLSPFLPRLPALSTEASRPFSIGCTPSLPRKMWGTEPCGAAFAEKSFPFPRNPVRFLPFYRGFPPFLLRFPALSTSASPTTIPSPGCLAIRCRRSFSWRPHAKLITAMALREKAERWA